MFQYFEGGVYEVRPIHKESRLEIGANLLKLRYLGGHDDENEGFFELSVQKSLNPIKTYTVHVSWDQNHVEGQPNQFDVTSSISYRFTSLLDFEVL